MCPTNDHTTDPCGRAKPRRSGGTLTAGRLPAARRAPGQPAPRVAGTLGPAEATVIAATARIIFARTGRVTADLRPGDWPRAARIAIAAFELEATRLGAFEEDIAAQLAPVRRPDFLARSARARRTGSRSLPSSARFGRCLVRYSRRCAPHTRVGGQGGRPGR